MPAQPAAGKQLFKTMPVMFEIEIDTHGRGHPHHRSPLPDDKLPLRKDSEMMQILWRMQPFFIRQRGENDPLQFFQRKSIIRLHMSYDRHVAKLVSAAHIFQYFDFVLWYHNYY